MLQTGMTRATRQSIITVQLNVRIAAAGNAYSGVACLDVYKRQSCSKPFADRYCACTGISVVSAAASAFTVLSLIHIFHAVIDGDKANATLTQDFHNLTDVSTLIDQAPHMDWQFAAVLVLSLIHI